LSQEELIRLESDYVAHCPDLVLITKPKIFQSSSISIIFDPKGFCHSRRYPGVLRPPPSEIFLPTKGSARYAYQIDNYFKLLRNARYSGKMSAILECLFDLPPFVPLI
jgi:hypothetical protein